MNVPAGLWGKRQFTVQEVEESRKISKARIHVERAIKHIKDFKILANKVPRQMLPHLSKVFYVCCQLCNLQPIKLRELDDANKNMTAE